MSPEIVTDAMVQLVLDSWNGTSPKRNRVVAVSAYKPFEDLETPQEYLNLLLPKSRL